MLLFLVQLHQGTVTFIQLLSPSIAWDQSLFSNDEELHLMSLFNLKKSWKEFWLSITLLARDLVKEMHLLKVQILVVLLLQPTSVSASTWKQLSEKHAASHALLPPFCLTPSSSDVTFASKEVVCCILEVAVIWSNPWKTTLRKWQQVNGWYCF